tara:strand:+ start:1303 stop:1611 length:309 start_codon:yes stop_codon:yes gene_type:complete
MKNIETPLTWGLGILALVLILLSSLNTTSINFNISDMKSNANNGFDLNHDHDIQEATVYNINNGPWGEKTCSGSSYEEASSDSTVVIYEEGEEKIDEDSSEE